MEGSPEENEGGGEETGFHPWPWNGDNSRMALNVAFLSFNDCRYISIRNRKKKIRDKSQNVWFHGCFFL